MNMLRFKSRLMFVLSIALLVAASGCTNPNQGVQRYPMPLFDTKPDQPRAAQPLVRVAPPRPMPTPQPTLPRPTGRSLVGKTIVVDAGHGGKDPGAIGVGPMVEKAVNLCVSRIVVDLLSSRGANVVTSRTGDTFMELDDRAALAERSRADLFVSVHADSIGRSSVSGSTVYIARSASGDSQRAAARIEQALKQAGIECRGVRGAGFRVLVGHSRPAVLIECGYLTNAREARLLSQAEYQRRLATAIAEGIAAHFAG